MPKKKKIKGYILEALDKLPSAKVLCAIVFAIILATILYLTILFLIPR